MVKYFVTTIYSAGGIYEKILYLCISLMPDGEIGTRMLEVHMPQGVQVRPVSGTKLLVYYESQ